MTVQIVLMTGCSSGIGLATAVRLARDPDQRFVIIATVIALAEKTDLVAAVGDALDKIVFIKELDITNDANITSVVEDVIKTYGRIDILFNIAGVIIANVPERVTRKEIDHIFGVNLTGPIRLTQAVLPHMKNKRSGKIISFSSISGKIGCPYFEFYCASKFGIEGFFESLAAGVKAFNIRVHIIEPESVATSLMDGTLRACRDICKNDKSLDDIDRQELARRTELVETTVLAQPDEFADALVRRILDVANPDLRHLMCRDVVKEPIARAVADLSGETVLAMMIKGVQSEIRGLQK